MFGLTQQNQKTAPVADRQPIGHLFGGTSAAFAPAAETGVTAGTKVATAMGWRPVEALTEGDLVLTFDRGLRPLKAVIRTWAWMTPHETPMHQWPLLIPTGALGNAVPLVLLSQQPVMLESDAAEVVFGDPFTLVRAEDLDGFRGIDRVAPQGPTEIIVLQFECDELIYAETGALLHCAAGGMLDLDMLDAPESYRCLDSASAADLLDCIEADEDAAAGLPNAAQPQSANYAALA